MKEYDSEYSIEVLGAIFNGVSGLIKYSSEGIDNDGVYVGCDCERYPCFDSEDYDSENRCFWNFVFAKDKDVLAEKLEQLKRIDWKRNYNKITEQLHPMAYWQGSKYYKVLLTEGT